MFNGQKALKTKGFQGPNLFRIAEKMPDIPGAGHGPQRTETNAHVVNVDRARFVRIGLDEDITEMDRAETDPATDEFGEKAGETREQQIHILPLPQHRTQGLSGQRPILHKISAILGTIENGMNLDRGNA